MKRVFKFYVLFLFLASAASCWAAAIFSLIGDENFFGQFFLVLAMLHIVSFAFLAFLFVLGVILKWVSK